MGRFYYRRPDGESSSDVFDRVSDLWDSIFAMANNGSTLSWRQVGAPSPPCSPALALPGAATLSWQQVGAPSLPCSPGLALPGAATLSWRQVRAPPLPWCCASASQVLGQHGATNTALLPYH